MDYLGNFKNSLAPGGRVEGEARVEKKRHKRWGEAARNARGGSLRTE